jgi:hypothetical protein
MKRLMLSTIAACMILSSSSRGEFILTFSQGGANVVATGSGTIDLSSLSLVFTPIVTPVPYIDAEAGAIFLGSQPLEGDAYAGILGPATFGPGSIALATTSVGDSLGFAAGNAPPIIIVPPGYVSGQSLSDQSTWHNTTISGLGLTPDTYTWSWGSGPTADSFVLIIPGTISAVPEPGSMILAATATGVVSLGTWFRRWKDSWRSRS